MCRAASVNTDGMTPGDLEALGKVLGAMGRAPVLPEVRRV
jgi:hypothetical protein